MTNTKPTWEDELNKFYGAMFECGDFDVLWDLVKKVEQEAYKRGKGEEKKCQFPSCDFCLNVMSTMREQELKIKDFNKKMQ